MGIGTGNIRRKSDEVTIGSIPVKIETRFRIAARNIAAGQCMMPIRYDGTNWVASEYPRIFQGSWQVIYVEDVVKNKVLPKPVLSYKVT